MPEALYLLIADAHQAVLHENAFKQPERNDPVPMIEEIVARLEAAKAMYLAGNRVEASRLFDPRYEVTAAVREASACPCGGTIFEVPATVHECGCSLPDPLQRRADEIYAADRAQEANAW